MDQAFALDRSVFHLSGPGPIPRADNEPEFWAIRNRDELVAGHVLTVFSYSSAWDFQERHPDGDELAAVIDGEVDLLLDAGDGEFAVRVTAGHACVIPAGAWHRVVVCEPSTLLFVTPVPARTEHRGVGLET